MLATLCPFAQSPSCDRWAAAGECEANPSYMNASCADACAAVKSCDTWATAGECDRNPSYMNVTCASACALERTRAEKDRAEKEARAALIRASCSRWADDGECSANAAFMAGECASDCARVARREVCSAEECAGAPAACAPATGPPPTGHKAIGTLPVQLAVRNDGGQPIQLFWLDRGLNSTERPFSVVMPRSRYTQPTFVGHLWRLRVLAARGEPPASGRLLRDVYAGLLRVGRCDCERHARRAADYAAPADDDGDDAAEPPAAAVLLLEMRDVQSAAVATSDGSVDLGVLAPRGLAGGNRTHLLLNGNASNGTRPGSLLSARRDGDGGGLLMQHLVGDIVVDDRRCLAEAADDAGESGAEDEEEAREKRALQRERAELRRQNERLRDHLGRLKAVDPAAVKASGDLGAARKWVADAAAALGNLVGRKAEPKEKAAPRRARGGRRAPHDELR